MNTHFRQHTDKDPLCGFFRWGSKHFPITNSHICIVDGHVAPEILKIALSKLVQKFESLRDLHKENALSGRKNDIFKTVSTTLAMEFDSPEFRREVLDFVAKSESGGILDSPLKLHVIYGEEGKRSCIHLGVSHDLADVKSGNILLSALLKEYQKLLVPGEEKGKAELSCAGESAICKHFPLVELQPTWYKGGATLRRKAKAYIEIAKRMSTSKRSRVIPSHQTDWNQGEAEGNDFYNQRLPEELQHAILASAKRYRTTVNTLFSAALARYMANQQFSTNSPSVFTMAVSLRNLLGEKYSDAFRSFMIDCRMSIPAEPDTEKLLRNIQSEVEAIRQERLELEVGRMENAIPLFRQPLPKSLVYWIMKRTQGTNILYSNPGIVEEALDCFGADSLPIRDVAIFGCLVPPYDLMFLTPMINGRIQLTVVYRRKVFQDIHRQFVSPFLQELDKIIA